MFRDPRHPRRRAVTAPHTHDARVKYVGVMPYAMCSCGWEAPTRDHGREAADDVRAHLRDPESRCFAHGTDPGPDLRPLADAALPEDAPGAWIRRAMTDNGGAP